jgi:hypothetical protein
MCMLAGRTAARLAAGLLALAAVGAPGRAEAACSGSMTPRWSAHQALVLLLNPTGAEHNLRVGLCVPLYDTDEPALSLNLVEAGVSTYLSPIYAVGGAYAQISPATFFFARVEAHGIGIWPLPLPGAGYYAMDGYDAPYRSADLPESAGGTAGGWNVRLIGVLRGRVEIGERSLVGQSTFFADYQEVGSAPFYLNVRQDLVSARADWVLGNELSLLLGAPLGGGAELRVGFFDVVRGVPTGAFLHQLGALVVLAWERPTTGLDSLSIFVRVGGYTDHPIRAGETTTLALVAIDHDLGGI